MANQIENENIVKITVTKEAVDKLFEVMNRVNEGFDGGRVNRQDLASWIIEKFEKNVSESDISQIRKDFFSEKLWLENILKRSKETGEVPEFLRDVLRKNWSGQLVAPMQGSSGYAKPHSKAKKTKHEGTLVRGSENIRENENGKN